MSRISSRGRSFAASKSLTIVNNKDYAGHYHAPSHALVQTKVANRETNCVSKISPSQLSNLFQFDKSKAASMGVAFAMTYNFISNINGSITLSTAWYIASARVSNFFYCMNGTLVASETSIEIHHLLTIIWSLRFVQQTGLSPLVGGQWKSLMSAYGSLYLFVTLMRPLRFALAVSLTKHTERLIEETQSRLGCARPIAIGLDVAMGLFLWITTMAGGVLFASALSGVPIY
jgi:hypothetical protein